MKLSKFYYIIRIAKQNSVIAVINKAKDDAGTIKKETKISYQPAIVNLMPIKSHHNNK
jgi:hypothetical protein